MIRMEFLRKFCTTKKMKTLIMKVITSRLFCSAELSLVSRNKVRRLLLMVHIIYNPFIYTSMMPVSTISNKICRMKTRIWAARRPPRQNSSSISVFIQFLRPSLHSFLRKTRSKNWRSIYLKRVGGMCSLLLRASSIAINSKQCSSLNSTKKFQMKKHRKAKMRLTFLQYLRTYTFC